MTESDKISFIFSKYAQNYLEKYNNFSLYDESMNFFSDNFKNSAAKILDVGCGPGNLIRKLLISNSRLEILGIDIAEEMLKLARFNCPNARFEKLNCKEIESLNLNFDGILVGFVFPYLNAEEIQQFIKSCSNILNKNGLIYFSTLEDNPSSSKYIASSLDENDVLFINYHEFDFLQAVLEANNFQVIYKENLEFPDKRDNSKDLIVIAKRN